MITYKVAILGQDTYENVSKVKKHIFNWRENFYDKLEIVSGGGKNIYIDSSTSSYYDRIYSGEWGSQSYVYPSQLRDTSGWYHVVFAVDTTQSTASNRIKFYINFFSFNR